MNFTGVRQTPIFWVAVQNGWQNMGATSPGQQAGASPITQWLNQFHSSSFGSGASPSFNQLATSGFLSAPSSAPSYMMSQLPGLTQQFGQNLGSWMGGGFGGFGNTGAFGNFGSFFQQAMQSMMGMFQMLQQATQMQQMSQQLRNMAFMGGGLGMRFGGMGGMSGLGMMGGMGGMQAGHAGHQHGMTGIPGFGTPGTQHTHGTQGVHQHGHSTGPGMKGQMLINGQPNGSIQAGKPTELSFQFTDPTTGKPIKDFDLDHGKQMHAIIVSDDLSTFSHIHPPLGPDGKFNANLNQADGDPDNINSQNAFPKGGKYMVFGEASPQGQGPQQTRFDVNASGPSQPVKLTPDPQIAPGQYQKYFNADGSPGGPGAPYQVTLTVRKEMHDGKPTLHFDYNVKEATKNPLNGNTEYKPTQNMEDWLGMPGHGVLIGANGASANDRVFRHMHAGGDAHAHGAPGGGHSHGPGDAGHAHGPTAPRTGENLSFALNDQDIPPSGTYKMWGQFKHNGKVLTFPFTFDL